MLKNSFARSKQNVAKIKAKQHTSSTKTILLKPRVVASIRVDKRQYESILSLFPAGTYNFWFTPGTRRVLNQRQKRKRQKH